MKKKKSSFDKPFSKELIAEINKTSILCSSILRQYRNVHKDLSEYQSRMIVGNHLVILEEKTREFEGEDACVDTDIVNRVVRDFYIGVINNLVNH